MKYGDAMPAAKALRALAEVEIGQSPSLRLLNHTKALTRGNAFGRSTLSACLEPCGLGAADIRSSRPRRS